jgi:DNA polymerase II small subunit/DNA polymerase delta subunit B
MDIFKKIMSLGVLISEDVIENIKSMSEAQQQELFERIRKEKPVFIDKNFLFKKEEVKIEIFEKEIKIKELSIQDYTEILSKYYEFYREILTKKLNPLRLVTISSLHENIPVGIIGIVKNVFEKKNEILLELEDKTGSCKVILDKNIIKDEFSKIFLDEVIGIEGIYKDGVINAEKLVFPDIEEVKQEKIEEEIFLEGFFDGESLKFEINKNSGVATTNPIWVRVNDLKILIFVNKQNLSPIILLKKRNLFPGRIYECYLINEIPHIFLTTTTPSFRETYKGVRIFGLDKDEKIRINLKDMKEEI